MKFTESKFRILTPFAAIFVLLLFGYTLNADQQPYVHVEAALQCGRGSPIPSDEVFITTNAAPLEGSVSDSYSNGFFPADSAYADIIADYYRLYILAEGTGAKNSSGNPSATASLGPEVGGSPLANYFDYVTLTSPTLSNGTPVVVSFGLVLSGAAVQDGIAMASLSGNLTVSVVNRSPFPGFNKATVNVAGQTSFFTNMDLEIGDRLSIASGFYASGWVSSGALAPGTSDTYLITGGGLVVHSDYASLFTYMSPQTADVSYTNESQGTFPVYQPLLTIVNQNPAGATITWPSPGSDGFVLQQNSSPGSNGWVNSTNFVNDDTVLKSVQIAFPSNQLYFRLIK